MNASDRKFPDFAELSQSKSELARVDDLRLSVIVECIYLWYFQDCSLELLCFLVVSKVKPINMWYPIEMYPHFLSFMCPMESS
jgi:hypothetical protein